MFLGCQEENSLSVAKFSVYQPHGELAVKIRVRADSSHLEVDVIISNEVCQEALNFLHLDSAIVFGSYALDETLSFLEGKDGMFHWVGGHTYNELVADRECPLNDI